MILVDRPVFHRIGICGLLPSGQLQFRLRDKDQHVEDRCSCPRRSPKLQESTTGFGRRPVRMAHPVCGSDCHLSESLTIGFLANGRPSPLSNPRMHSESRQRSSPSPRPVSPSFFFLTFGFLGQKFTSCTGCIFLDIDNNRKLARGCNEYSAQARSDHPGRFGFYGNLPDLKTDLHGCLRELEFSLDSLGADGICLMTSYGGQYLGHPESVLIRRIGVLRLCCCP